MSSTAVSHYIGFNEQFQCKDPLNHNSTFTQQQYLDLLTQAHNETSNFVKTDLPACLGAIPANGAGRQPISRRHTSMFAPNASRSAGLASFSENNGFFTNAFGSALETVSEERFRNRAYSEGSSVLSNETLLDQQQQAQSGTSRYKTELCRPFEENGKCKYGDKCQFAHGKHELRHMVRHPKYKTELCRTYHTSGLCPYGPRCHFIHNQDEPTVGMQRQIAMNAVGIQSNRSVPQSINNPIQRQNNGNRPSNLQLLSQQRAVTRLNSHSYSPPLETPSPFFGINDNSVISPISPIGHGVGQSFQYGNHVVSPTEVSRTNKFRCLSENRQPSPPLTQFDFAQNQFLDLSVHDDVVFDGPPTPPDSDRESATGSPPGFAAPAPSSQRLPIFKCLSQSD